MAGTHIDITGDDRKFLEALSRSQKATDEFIAKVEKAGKSTDKVFDEASASSKKYADAIVAVGSTLTELSAQADKQEAIVKELSKDWSDAMNAMQEAARGLELGEDGITKEYVDSLEAEFKRLDTTLEDAQKNLRLIEDTYSRVLTEGGKKAKQEAEEMAEAVKKSVPAKQFKVEAGEIEAALKELEARYQSATKVFGEAMENDKLKNKTAAQKAYLQELSEITKQANALSQASMNESSSNPAMAKAHQVARKLIGEVNTELKIEKENQEKVNEVKQKELTLLAQKRQILNEMTKLETSGKRDTAEFKALEDQLTKVGTAINVVNKNAKNLTTAGSAQLAGIIQGVTGLSGAFAAGQGVVSLFVKDNEKLAAIQTKLQAAMSITIGLQQVSATLHATSQFRIVTVTKVTQLWNAAQKALNTTLGASAGLSKLLISGGIMALVVGIGYLISKYSEWKKNQEEIIRLNKIVSDSLKNASLEGKKNAQQELVQLNLLYKASQNDAKSKKERIRAVEEIQSLYPSYFGNLTKEEILAGKGATAYNNLATSILNAARARAAQDKIVENETKKLELDAKRVELQSKLEKWQNSRNNAGTGTYFATPNMPLTQATNEMDSKIDDLTKQISGVTNEIEKLDEASKKLADTINIPDLFGGSDDKIIEGSKAYWQKIRDDQQKIMDANLPASAIFKAAKKQRDEAAKMIEKWDKTNTNKEESAAQKMRDAALKIANIQAELNNDAAKRLLDNEQKLLDIEQESFDKRFRQNQLNLAKELLTINEYRQKIAKSQQEAAKDIYVSKTGSDKGFNYSSFDKSLLPKELQPESVEAEIKRITEIAQATFNKGFDDISKDLKAFADEERLTFASQLDQQIYTIRTHYAQRRIEAKNNANLLKQISENENREITAIRLQEQQKQLESNADYNQKYKELVNDRSFFESDRNKASLEQQIKDQKIIFNNLEKQLFNDPNNKELANQLRSAFINLRVLNKELEKTPEQKLAEIANLFGQISDSLSDITGFDISPLSNVFSGISSFAQQDYLGAATSGLGLVSGFVSGILSKKEKEAAIQREINKLQQQYNIDLRQQNYDLISSIDYARAFKDNLEALHWLVEKGFISNKDFSVWEELNEQAKKANENILAAQANYNKLEAKGNDFLNEAYRLRDEAGWKKYKDIVVDWKKGIISTEESLRRLSAAGWSGLGDLADQLSRAGEETNKWKDQIAELSQQMDEFATGTSFDGFLSDAANALKEFRGDIASLADFTEEKLTNAILSSFKYQILSNALKPMYDELADMFLSGKYDTNAANDWKRRLTDILATNGKELDKIFESFGIDPDDQETSPTSKGIASLSQDSFNEYIGIANATLNKATEILNVNRDELIQIVSLNTGVADIQQIMRENSKIIQDSLNVQIKIERNTFRTAELLDKFDTKGIVIRN